MRTLEDGVEDKQRVVGYEPGRLDQHSLPRAAQRPPCAPPQLPSAAACPVEGELSVLCAEMEWGRNRMGGKGGWRAGQCRMTNSRKEMHLVEYVGNADHCLVVDE